jgi:hypothetical protein
MLGCKDRTRCQCIVGYVWLSEGSRIFLKLFLRKVWLHSVEQLPVGTVERCWIRFIIDIVHIARLRKIRELFVGNFFCGHFEFVVGVRVR